jgi:hypothetical protein
MENCFLCGKPAVKKMEIEVGSSVTSMHHDGHLDHDSHGHHVNHGSHTARGTTRHYALQPLCADCVKQKEEEAAQAAKVGAVVLGGMGIGMGVIALVGCVAPFFLFAIGGLFFYFFGQQ